MTLTGLILIPLCLLLILAPWRWALMALPSIALLHAASILQLGSFGLQPGLFFGLMIVGRTLVEVLLTRQSLNRHVLRLMTPMFLLVILAVLTLWAALVMFQGQVYVIGGSDGFDLDRAAPYVFRRENITQLAYLVLHVAVLYAVAHQVARRPEEERVDLLYKGMAAALVFASVCCLWHWASFRFGFIPWPTAFFQSNPMYRGMDQMLFGELRVNGPFSEPSALAYFYAGFLYFAWFRFRQQATSFGVLMIGLCLVALFLSRSTTGFLVIGVFGLLVAQTGLALFLRRRIAMPRLRLGGAAAALVLLAASFGGTAYVVQNLDEVQTVFEKMVLQKTESSSFEERSTVNLMALDITVETGGIGIGLGSHKPSALPLTLLSNVGVLGFLAFALFTLDLLRPRTVTREDGSRSRDSELSPLRWHLLGLLMIHAFSNPNLSMVMLWVSFAFLAGAIAAHRAAERRVVAQGVRLAVGPGYA